MSISIHPELEAELRTRAELSGVSVESYICHMLVEEERLATELEALGLEGLDSGHLAEMGPGYWEVKHQQLDELLKESAKIEKA